MATFLATRHKERLGGVLGRFSSSPGLWDAEPSPGAYDELYGEPSKMEKIWVPEDDAQPLN